MKSSVVESQPASGTLLSSQQRRCSMIERLTIAEENALIRAGHELRLQAHRAQTRGRIEIARD